MNPLDEIAKAKLRQRMLSHVEGDALRFPPEFLADVLLGERQLTAAERATLLGSPVTLRQMHAIERALEGARAPAAVPMPANDDYWAASDGLLRAAASGDAAFVLVTDDGFWKLEFPRADEGWWIVLRLDRSAPFANEFLAESNRPEVAVLDGLGATLLIGTLDDDGSLLGRWPGIQPPMAAISAAGGGFQVLRV